MSQGLISIYLNSCNKLKHCTNEENGSEKSKSMGNYDIQGQRHIPIWRHLWHFIPSGIFISGIFVMLPYSFFIDPSFLFIFFLKFLYKFYNPFLECGGDQTVPELKLSFAILLITSANLRNCVNLLINLRDN